RAELIEGIVYMRAAVSWNHGKPLGLITTWAGHYCSATPGTDFANDVTDRLDEANEPQPDLALIVLPEFGGQTSISDDGYLTGAAELIVEISVSTVATDRGPKLRSYEMHGVKEYVIWRVAEQVIEWYGHDGKRLAPRSPDDQGIFRSRVFPGLWLDTAAALCGRLSAVINALDQGLATDEHAAFIQSLKSCETSD
ncbi:MAG: Uma2 family endonuclease, partial [Planctomycetota bacterium]